MFRINLSASLLALLIPVNLLLADPKGAALYLEKSCHSCHGTSGEGNRLLKAPALAGQDPVYLARQLSNFKVNNRGYADNDVYGKAMAATALSLSADDITAVAAYLHSLEPEPEDYSLHGNPQLGANIFENSCAACHGGLATGNPALNAPNLMILNDWYIVEQLKKFKNGWRGQIERDPIGATMAPNAILLQNERDFFDLAAYIFSLRFAGEDN